MIRIGSKVIKMGTPIKDTYTVLEVTKDIIKIAPDVPGVGSYYVHIRIVKEYNELFENK